MSTGDEHAGRAEGSPASIPHTDAADHHAGEVLARRYLAETGLTATAAAEAYVWESIAIPLDRVLDGKTLQRWSEDAQWRRNLDHYASLVMNATLSGPLPDRLRPTTPEHEAVVALWERVRHDRERLRRLEEEEGAPLGWLMDYEPYRAVRQAHDALMNHAAAEHERQRPAKVAALLATPDGPRRPSPLEWLTANATEGAAGALEEATFPIALYRLAIEEKEKQLYVEVVRRQRLEKRVERLKQRAEIQLGDRIVMPHQLREAGWKTDPMRGRLEAIEQGELFPAGARSLEILKQAEATVEGRQFARLPAPEVRALMAALRVFSSGGDDKQQFRQQAVTVPARLLYRAAGVDPRKSALCRSLVSAVDALGRRQVYASLRFSEPPAQGAPKDAAPRWLVLGERTSVLHVTPVWRDRSEREAKALAQRWAARGVLNPSEEAEPWEGPLPDEYVLALPPIMAKVWGALVLNGDVLARLETGAKHERGERQGFQSIDWALFMEITQRTQAGQTSEDGRSLKAYVDRDDFLSGFYGPAEVAKYRASGRYTSRCVKQYEHAAGVLLAGGLVQEYQPQQQVRRGVRDVFVLSADVVRGVEDRALEASRAPELAAGPASPPAPKRGRKRGRTGR